MDTLRDRLAELADDAPTGGTPAAELWARGKRGHRLRAAALAVTVLVVAVGTGIGVRVADKDSRDVLKPAGHLGFALPIAYPAREELPSLGRAPGQLAAIWTDTRPGGGAPTAVGLVAASGKFGTLPIALPNERPAPGESPGAVLALSPDGRRIAYWSSTRTLTVRDLVSGETYSPGFDFQTRPDLTWVDATHLVGHGCCSDVDGWVWQPGQPPKQVDPHPWLEGDHGQDVWAFSSGDGPPACSIPVTLANKTRGTKNVPVLCDILGFIGSGFVLGHQRGPDDSNGTVVAVDVRGATFHTGHLRPQDHELDKPALRHVIVTAPAPERVAFATNL